jgi:hypothetical protein
VRVDLYAASGTLATTTNNPIDARIASFINDAYLDLWDASGGRMRAVGSELAWTAASTCAGSAMGILTEAEFTAKKTELLSRL